MSPKPKISIVVCTYNREDVLSGCFDSLLDQTANKDDYEIILVNNNSTDNTQKISEEYAQKYNNFRAVVETEQGLSNARNRGYKEAQSEYVAYIDDDAKATPTWVETALKIIKDHTPDIFGGPIDPFYLDDKTVPWMRPEYNQYSHYGATRFITDEFLSGSNIVFRKQLLEEYGGFNPKLGMIGGKAAYHEETALQIRAQQEKRRLYYSKDLLVYHLVPANKQHILYYIASKYKSGKDALDIWERPYRVSDLIEVSSLINEIMTELGNAMNGRDKDKFPYPENYVLDKLNKKFVQLGYYNGVFASQWSNKRLSVGETLSFCWYAIRISTPMVVFVNFIRRIKRLFVKVKRK